MQVPDEVIFVFSSGENKKYGTKIFRDSVIAQLKKEGFNNDLFKDEDCTINLGKDMRDYGEVYNKIENELNELGKKHENIYVQLGYSGGTKTMVIAAAQAVQKFCNDNKLEFSFIDIDPANDRLMVSNNGEPQTNPYPKDIQLNEFFKKIEISLTLEDIYKLHNRNEYKKYEEIGTGNRDIFDKLYNDNLYPLLSDKGFRDCWDKLRHECKFKNCPLYQRLSDNGFKDCGDELWHECEFGNCKKKIFGKHHRDRKLMQMFMIEFIEHISEENFFQMHPALFNGFPEVDKWKKCEGDSTKCEGNPTKCDKCRKDLSHLIKMLDGIWVEGAVLKALDDIVIEGEKYFDELRSNIRLHLDKDDINKNFEVDVLARRGYQLYLFSCTRDDSAGLCKEKAFEAYMRSQQLGGEHACFCLVCLIKNGKIISENLDHFEASQNFCIVDSSAFKDNDTLKKALMKALKIREGA